MPKGAEVNNVSPAQISTIKSCHCSEPLHFEVVGSTALVTEIVKVAGRIELDDIKPYEP